MSLHSAGTQPTTENAASRSRMPTGIYVDVAGRHSKMSVQICVHTAGSCSTMSMRKVFKVTALWATTFMVVHSSAVHLLGFGKVGVGLHRILTMLNLSLEGDSQPCKKGCNGTADVFVVVGPWTVEGDSVLQCPVWC